VLQTADSDCAPACLAMILKSYGENASLAAMRVLLDPGRDGTTMSAIRDAAVSFGLAARAVRMPEEKIRNSGSTMPTPFIAHWAGDHFVVVERISTAVVVCDVGRVAAGQGGHRAIIPCLCGTKKTPRWPRRIA